MAVCHQVPLLCVWLLCLLLFLLAHVTSLKTGRNGTDAIAGVPIGCNVSTTVGGLSLNCWQVPFNDIIETVQELGPGLVEVTAKQCRPRPAVRLDEAALENPNLTEFVVSDCGMEYVGMDIFTGFRHLNKLSLFSNIISTFTTDTLSDVGNLTELDLSINQILVLTTRSFMNMGNLTYLNVAYNKIASIDNGTFQGLTKLTTLELSNNAIEHFIPDTFTGLFSLQRLDLSHNKIRVIRKEMFGNLDGLTCLSLSRNDITHLGDYAFNNLSMLQNLILDENPRALLNYDNDKPKLFGGLQKLKHLNLAYMNLARLETVDLDAVFRDQRYSLEGLDLRSTRLTNNLLGMVKKLERLKELSLRNNDVGYINTSTLPKVTHIRCLNLKNNKITYIDEAAFEEMDNGSSVELSRNPIDCSCKDTSFSGWLRSRKGEVVVDRDEVTCGSPINLHGTKVMDYNPYWWQCSRYMPLVALVFIVSFLLIIALVVLIVYCNRINLKHWLLGRRVASMPTYEERYANQPTEGIPLLNPAMCRNSLKQGKTGAYIIHDIYERSLLEWVNKYLEDQLHNHPMKITLQFPAGPEVILLWKQIKDFSFQVNSFLVLVTDGFLANHWPEIAEKSGVDNIMKCVFVLHGKKTSELPKEMKRLQCPCFQWPETGTRFTTLERERDQFWKQVRIAVKVTR